MKNLKLFFLQTSLLISLNSFSQVIQDSVKVKKHYKEVSFLCKNSGFSLIDSYPMYPNGVDGINQLIINNIRYPEKAKDRKIEGEVIIEFTVNEFGYIANIKVIKSVNKLLDKESIRVLKLMERWEPAYQNGKPIKFTLTQSFVFKI